mmetsp:Transcript_39324/g.93180  ORF Transcript_39324/g.93180 Transcript_39324/m.93180 type:complete len:206 (+) Transcript_39324:1016-1633(+)
MPRFGKGRFLGAAEEGKGARRGMERGRRGMGGGEERRGGSGKGGNRGPQQSALGSTAAEGGGEEDGDACPFPFPDFRHGMHHAPAGTTEPNVSPPPPRSAPRGGGRGERGGVEHGRPPHCPRLRLARQWSEPFFGASARPAPDPPQLPEHRLVHLGGVQGGAAAEGPRLRHRRVERRRARGVEACRGVQVVRVVVPGAEPCRVGR